MITGNLKGPQRLVPDSSPNKIDFELYTNSTVKNITIGVRLEKFRLNDTISILQKAFLKPVAASTNPPRRKSVEIFGNCSLILKSNFETMWCYQHYFQGYPRTKDPKDAYLGVTGFSRSTALGRAGEILELVGDNVVNLVILSAYNNRKSRATFGIQVPDWDKKHRNSSFFSDFTPRLDFRVYSPFYITCNLTMPNRSRPCTHYELRSYSIRDPVTKKIQRKYYMKLLEKFDLNSLAEFDGQHILKIGAVASLPRIIYVTRRVGGERKEIKLLTRYNGTIVFRGNYHRLSRKYRAIEEIELPVNLTNDDNFDICLGTATLVMFVSPSKHSKTKSIPRVFIHRAIYARLTLRQFGSFRQFFWQEVNMDAFNFSTIRRIQCFPNYFTIIGDDSLTAGNKTRVTVFQFSRRFARYDTNQYFIDNGYVALGGTQDALNMRRYDQVLDKAEPGLEYHVKFMKLTQRNQMVFNRATFLLYKSVFHPWYWNDDLLNGSPPDTSSEKSLSQNYSAELNIQARTLYDQTVYVLKGSTFKDNKPTDLNQTVLTEFGPPNLKLENQAYFVYTNLLRQTDQEFKLRESDSENKIEMQDKEYKLQDLVEAKGDIRSLEIYYNGGEVFNVTSSPSWPLLIDKLYLERKTAHERSRLQRRFTSIIDFSASFSRDENNKTQDDEQSKKKKRNLNYDKEFITSIYLNNDPIPVDQLISNEPWDNTDLYSGLDTTSKVPKKMVVALFQSQYFNASRNNYLAKVVAKVFSGTSTTPTTYTSLDAYESLFYVKTRRYLTLRNEGGKMIPYMLIYSRAAVSAFNFYKGNENFTNFKLYKATYPFASSGYKIVFPPIRTGKRLYFALYYPYATKGPLVNRVDFNFST